MTVLNKQRKIRILFDAQVHLNNFTKNSDRTGVFFVEYNILKQFATYDFLEIWLLVPQHGIKILKKYINEHIHIYPNVKIYAGEKLEFHLYFSPFYGIPEEVRKSGLQCFTISYDLVPLHLSEVYGDKFEDTWLYTTVNSWITDDYIFTISDYTRNDLIKYVSKLNPNKIITALLAASENFCPESDMAKNFVIRNKYNIPHDKNYFFSLCSLEPRKNLIFSIKNFIKFIEKNSIDNLVFVLGGGHWDMFIKTLETEINNLGKYKSKIILVGYADDEDLASLYSHAECMVYTSIYEGFGLPTLEAMQCGCPVITSNTTSLPEVVGDAGIMIDPTDDNAMIEAYEKIYFNENLRKELSKKGLERAKLFSWEKCAKIMVDTFLCNSHTPKTITLAQHSGVFSSAIAITGTNSYKKKYNFLGLPIVRIAENGGVKRINVLGIPVLKVIENTGMRKMKVFGIQIYKGLIKSRRWF